MNLSGNKHFYDLFAPEVRQDLKEVALAAFRRKEPFRNFVNPNIHKNGEIRILETAGSPMLDDEGSLLGYRGADTDITERKQAEEALRDSEQRYRSLFGNMLEGFAHCKMIFEDGKPQDFIYLGVNDSFERLTGLTNVVGHKVTEVIPNIRESNPELFEIYGRVASTGNPEKFETCIASLGIWFSIAVYSPERGHFVAMFDNITDRKRAEDNLRESEKRYRRLHETMRDAFVQVDMSGRITDFNRSLPGNAGLLPRGTASADLH